MNGTYLYDAMGMIRPVYVEEAEKHPFSTPAWKRVLPIAACLLLVLGLSLGVLQMLHMWNSSVQPVTPSEMSPGVTVSPEAPPTATPPADKVTLSAIDNLFVYLFFPHLDALLAFAAILVPLIALLRKKPSKTVHLVSFGLYLAHLLACVVIAYEFVYRNGWAMLQQEILPMIHTALTLLFVVPLLNGILYLPKRMPALVLAAAAVILLLRPCIPKKDLIDNDAVVSVESEKYGTELVNLIELSGGSKTAPCPTYLEKEYITAVIHMDDGSFYELRYVLDLRFSLFGEDEEHYVLIRFDAQGNSMAAWELNWRFERLQPGTEVTP